MTMESIPCLGRRTYSFGTNPWQLCHITTFSSLFQSQPPQVSLTAQESSPGSRHLALPLGGGQRPPGALISRFAGEIGDVQHDLEINSISLAFHTLQKCRVGQKARGFQRKHEVSKYIFNLSKFLGNFDLVKINEIQHHSTCFGRIQHD